MRDLLVGNPHNVHLTAARFMWSFVHEALGPAWQAQDLGKFLETQANRSETRRRLFHVRRGCLGSYGLSVIKMVIEKVLSRYASDSVFKMLVSCSYGTHYVDCGTWSGWMASYGPCRRRPAVSPCHQTDELRRILRYLVFLFYVGHECVVAPAISVSHAMTCL
jgi:hypothetical protein